MPVRWPAAPTSIRRSATSAPRPLIRTLTAASANASSPGLPRSGRCPTASARSTAHWPNRSPSPCTRSAGPATSPAGTSWSTVPAHRLPGGGSGQVRRSQDRHRRRHQRCSAADRQGHGRGRSPERLRRRQPAEDMELVFEASGIPAVLGGVLRATARGGTLIQVGNLPGAPAPAALGDLVTGKSPGSVPTVLWTRSATRCGPWQQAWTYHRSSRTRSGSTRQPKPCGSSATLRPAAAKSCSTSAQLSSSKCRYDGS